MAALNYKHLHYFWVVAKAGGIGRASERLHLTPQTISGQISLFEDVLGYRLFNRVGRRAPPSFAAPVASTTRTCLVRSPRSPMNTLQASSIRVTAIVAPNCFMQRQVSRRSRPTTQVMSCRRSVRCGFRAASRMK